MSKTGLNLDNLKNESKLLFNSFNLDSLNKEEVVKKKLKIA
jgi:hypothetical protein